MVYKWSAITLKNSQHHWSSGKYESKPQWDVIPHLFKWQLSKMQKMINVDEDREKGTILYCWQESKLV